MNEIISRSLQILPPGEQVRKTASFSFSTAYFSVEESEQRCVDTQVRRTCSTDLTDCMVRTRDQVMPSIKRAAGRSHAQDGVRLRQVYSNV